METYSFKVIVEPDVDFDGNPAGWHSFCPLLERQWPSTWGTTESEALKNIKEVLHLVVEDMLEDNERIPDEPAGQAVAGGELRVAVTL